MNIRQSLLAILTLHALISCAESSVTPPPTPAPIAGLKGWRFVPEMSDEFTGAQLDRTKWDDWCATFPGRRASGKVGEPCTDGFMMTPDNVRTEKGELVLTERFASESEKGGLNHYRRLAPYAGAIVKSVRKQRYGYFEVRAKVMAACVSNAFWLYDPFSDDPERKYTPGDYSEEIDVFETKGAPDFRGKTDWGVGCHNMTIHFYRTPYYEGVVNRTKYYPSNTWHVVDTGANLADGYHVWGLLWTPEKIEWYLDGKLNFTRENNGLFRRALHVNLDCEVFPDWFGIPDPVTLPAEYRIDYVRVWSHPDIDPLTESEELRIRGGLPNVAAKLAAGEPVTVAYLGGSITDAKNGWRSKSFAWLQKRYPKAKLREIQATICGTSAEFGAARFGADVLAKGVPDLLFVEFRVNGGTRSAVEGIVRQARRANPKMDIAFIYTVCSGMVEDMRKGTLLPFGRALEEVAAHYNLTSIDFAPPVIRACDLDIMAFSPDEAPAGKAVFAKDGVHPTTEGHEFYLSILARALPKCFATGQVGDYEMPEALEKSPTRCAEECELVPASRILAGNPDWTPVDVATDTWYTNSIPRTPDMLRGAYVTTREGTTIKFRYHGTTAICSDIWPSQTIVLSVTVDGEKPRRIERVRAGAGHLSGVYRIEPEGAVYGAHEVTIKVEKIPAGMRFYFGQVQILGGKFDS